MRNYSGLFCSRGGGNGEKWIFWEMSEKVCWYIKCWLRVELRTVVRFLVKGFRKMELLFFEWGKILRIDGEGGSLRKELGF